MFNYTLLSLTTGRALFCVKAKSARAAKLAVTKTLGYHDWDHYTVAEC